jgi:hypothetical protein
MSKLHVAITCFRLTRGREGAKELTTVEEQGAAVSALPSSPLACCREGSKAVVHAGPRGTDEK